MDFVVRAIDQLRTEMRVCKLLMVRRRFGYLPRRVAPTLFHRNFSVLICWSSNSAQVSRSLIHLFHRSHFDWSQHRMRPKLRPKQMPRNMYWNQSVIHSTAAAKSIFSHEFEGGAQALTRGQGLPLAQLLVCVFGQNTGYWTSGNFPPSSCLSRQDPRESSSQPVESRRGPAAPPHSSFAAGPISTSATL
jgi:hypothetical protein